MAEKSSHHVLVTGSNGAIGQPACLELLNRGHHVRGFDRKPFASLADSHVGELADTVAVRRAVDGMDTILHLGAAPTPEFDFLTEIMPSNIAGTFNIFEAAREAGVRRVVFASSLHVGSRPITGPLHKTADPVFPMNHYGLTKVYGEMLGEMYAERHGLEVLVARIGFLPRSQMFVDRLIKGGGQDVYLSPGDAGRFFTAAVEANLPQKYLILYAIGKALNPRHDLEPARRILGYEPQDVWPAGMAFPE